MLSARRARCKANEGTHEDEPAEDRPHEIDAQEAGAGAQPLAQAVAPRSRAGAHFAALVVVII
jgi:hypothetical protein